MEAGASVPASIDDYIADFPPPVRAVLRRIRATVRRAAPGADEVISYRMPAFKMSGVLLYFAAFKHHIGLFPPVSGDARIEKAIAKYAGPKGNLQFPLDEPIPYELIERIARLRVEQDRAKSQGKTKGKVGPKQRANARPSSTRKSRR
jgi:uncharacterized protein YdhG (YjbR/CyaY superfamily)